MKCHGPYKPYWKYNLIWCIYLIVRNKVWYVFLAHLILKEALNPGTLLMSHRASWHGLKSFPLVKARGSSGSSAGAGGIYAHVSNRPRCNNFTRQGSTGCYAITTRDPPVANPKSLRTKSHWTGFMVHIYLLRVIVRDGTGPKFLVHLDPACMGNNVEMT